MNEDSREWMPIDMGPKDGRIIEIGRTEDGKIKHAIEMQWRNATWTHQGKDIIWSSEPAEYAPTHWRPLIERGKPDIFEVTYEPISADGDAVERSFDAAWEAIKAPEFDGVRRKLSIEEIRSLFSMTQRIFGYHDAYRGAMDEMYYWKRYALALVAGSTPEAPAQKAVERELVRAYEAGTEDEGYDVAAGARAILAHGASREPEPVAWLRDQRGDHEGWETLDALFMLGAACPRSLHGATYSPLYPPQASKEDAERLKAELAQCHETMKMLVRIIHDMVVANQSAWIEWQHGQGAIAAMAWVHNGLDGSGQIPAEEAPYGKEPQAWYDANNSTPLPQCYCGRPSNIGWMGKGFCCQEHYAAARSAEGGKASG